ncbi:MAG: TRAP transporter substrate-binding protein DctP [Candidatus Competibacteraceae bacterium]
MSKPVTAIADLGGLKFRAYNKATSRLAQLVGAVPTQIEVPEIPQAFATGLVEAMITSPTTGVNSKAWDFVKHFYDLQAWIPKNMIIVNRRQFDALDEATQQAVRDAAAKAEQRGWEISMAEGETMKKELADNGMTVAPPSEELKAELLKVGVTMTDEWLQETGEDGKAVLGAYRGE